MHSATHPRKGQALVEFAIISAISFVLLAALFGVMAMLLQSSVAASTALSATMLLDEQVHQDQVSSTEGLYQKLRELDLYDDARLILTEAQYQAARNGTEPNFPRLNQKMLSLYQWDPDRERWRYPGAVMTYNGGPAILIPRVTRGNTEEITGWFRPVQLRYTPGDPVVDVSIYMASQPATAISYPTDADGFAYVATPHLADDGAVQQTASLPSGFSFDMSTVTNSNVASPNRGTYGLGVIYAYSTEVRPFRAVFQHEGTFRLIVEDN